jgi:hypothetical protein
MEINFIFLIADNPIFGGLIVSQRVHWRFWTIPDSGSRSFRSESDCATDLFTDSKTVNAYVCAGQTGPQQGACSELVSGSLE